MSFKVGIGQSKNPAAFNAGREAALFALRDLKDEYGNIAFVFASSFFQPEKVLEGIKSIIGDTPVIGSSTAGEIITSGIEKRSVTIAILRSDSLQFALGCGETVSVDSRAAGHKAAILANRHFAENNIDAELKRKVYIIFPDGLKGNCADVLRGSQEVLGRSFPIVGGSSGDDFLFQKTHQYYNKVVFSDSVVGILMGGDLTFGIGSRHGWKPLGKPRKVTRASANIIYEIDNQPAISIYEEYFGDNIQELKNEPQASMAILYPLGMAIAGEEEYLLRNPVTISDEGALICAAEVPQGEEIRLMMGNKDSVLDAAHHAAQTALKNLYGTKAKIVFVFSSISRDKLLGRGKQAEINLVRQVFGSHTPVVGFYTYGEQAPLSSEINIGQTYFQNASFVVLAMGD